MADEKRSLGGDYRGDCPGELRIICDKTIFPVWQIIGWIFSVSISVVIVIVVCSALVTNQIRTCSIDARNGQANDNIVCSTITQIVTNVTLSETNINAIAIAIVNLLQTTPTGGGGDGDGPVSGTLGENPFGMKNRGGQFPLALGSDRVLIEIEDSQKTFADGVTFESTRPGCTAPVIGIEVDSHDDNFDDTDWAGQQRLGPRDGKARTEKTMWREEDLDLPPFCAPQANANQRTYWSLLERPRVHFTRTYIKLKPGTTLPPQPPSGATDADKRAHPEDVADQPSEIYYQTGAPYAVFTAQQNGNPNLLKVFVLYVDFVTERPTLIEIPFESLRGGNIIDPDGVVHLVNNIKLDSINHEMTFQIGSGVRELTIAGYDFGPDNTDAAVLDRRNRDASGSYVACLTPDGGIYRVFRMDRDAHSVFGPYDSKCAIYGRTG